MPDYLAIIPLAASANKPMPIMALVMKTFVHGTQPIRSIRARFIRLRSPNNDNPATISSAMPHMPTISASLAKVRNSCSVIAPGDMATMHQFSNQLACINRREQ